jgi:VIT1/CCC1 family predicted Fe2+/Mn2+ transporter
VDSPFTVLAAIAAPAVLTNACSILTLGMSNRLARVVDRTRVVLSELARADISELQRRAFAAQLADLRGRTRLLLAAQRWFFISLGSFALVALLSVVSALPVPPGGHAVTVSLGLAAGTCGVFGLAWGCWLMVRETQLSVTSLAREADGLRVQA